MRPGDAVRAKYSALICIDSYEFGGGMVFKLISQTWFGLVVQERSGTVFVVSNQFTGWTYASDVWRVNEPIDAW